MDLSFDQPKMQGQAAKPTQHHAERVGRHTPGVGAVEIRKLARDAGERRHGLRLRDDAQQDLRMLLVDAALTELVVDAAGGNERVAQSDQVAVGLASTCERCAPVEVNYPTRETLTEAVCLAVGSIAPASIVTIAADTL